MKSKTMKRYYSVMELRAPNLAGALVKITKSLLKNERLVQVNYVCPTPTQNRYDAVIETIS